MHLYYSYIFTEFFQKVLLTSKSYSTSFKTKSCFWRQKFFILSQLNVKMTQRSIKREDYRFFFPSNRHEKKKLLSRRFSRDVRLLYYKQPYQSFIITIGTSGQDRAHMTNASDFFLNRTWKVIAEQTECNTTGAINCESQQKGKVF